MANWKTCDVGSEDDNICKIDARLHSIFQGLNLHKRTMARFGEMGVTSVQALNTIVDNREQMREFLLDAVGIDKTKGYLHVLEAGKVISAWEQTSKRVEVDNRRDAERLAANLPPQMNGEELLLLKKKFELAYYKGRSISKAFVPSKPYLELKLGHAETSWTAEKLTEVTSLAQAERHAQGGASSSKKELTLNDGDSISFKVLTKPFGIAMPGDSESLRARLRLMGNAFLFLKLKFPQKGVLATCTRALWDDYIEFLFGERVWGFTTKGPDGKPAACPHQQIVEGYDLAIRERVAERMSEGVDIEAAFDEAQNDKELKYVSFLCYFTTEITSARCRALSAPALRDLQGSGSAQPQKRILDDPNAEQLTKKQKKALAKAKAQARKPPVQDGQVPPPAAHQAPRKPKAKAKAQALMNGGIGDQRRAKLLQRTTAACSLGEGKMICFAFNNGEACRKTPCDMAHACQICEELHPKTMCPKGGA